MRVTRDLAETPLEEPPDDLFDSIMLAEEEANKRLPLRERFGRTVSVLAGYAMRPQLAMAALLVLMVGSSLVFIRSTPNGQGQVGVTEIGAPAAEVIESESRRKLARSLDADEESGEPGDGRNRPAAAAPAALVDASANRGAGPARSETDTYRDAITAYQEGRYAEAERLFSEVAAAGGEKAAAAALHEAHSARNGSGCQRAVVLYDQVSARYQGSTVSDESAWQAATCYQALGQTERARAHYRSLAERPAYATRASEALARLEPPVSVAAKSAEAEADAASSAAAVKAAPAKPAAKPASAGAAAPAKPASPAADSTP